VISASNHRGTLSAFFSYSASGAGGDRRLQSMTEIILDPRFLQVLLVALSMGLAGLARR